MSTVKYTNYGSGRRLPVMEGKSIANIAKKIIGQFTDRLCVMFRSRRVFPST